MRTQLALVFIFAILANVALSAKLLVDSAPPQHQKPPHHQHGKPYGYHRRSGVYVGGSKNTNTAVTNNFGASSAKYGSTSSNVSNGSSIAQSQQANVINSYKSAASNLNIPTNIAGAYLGRYKNHGGHGGHYGGHGGKPHYQKPSQQQP